jgi:hypothetical protein
MSTKPAVRSSSARVVPNGLRRDAVYRDGKRFYEPQLVWQTAGTPAFHARSGKLQIPIGSPALDL